MIECCYHYCIAFVKLREYDYIGKNSSHSITDFNCSSHYNHFHPNLHKCGVSGTQQRQQLQQGQLQLTTVTTNTTNTNGNDSISLSSPTSSPPPINMNIRPSIQTDFNPNTTYPRISKFAYVDPLALVLGDCEIGKLVLVAPFAVCRGDEGTPIRIGDYSNMQDGVILHALETTSHGKNMDDRRYLFLDNTFASVIV